MEDVEVDKVVEGSTTSTTWFVEIVAIVEVVEVAEIVEVVAIATYFSLNGLSLIGNTISGIISLNSNPNKLVIVFCNGMVLGNTGSLSLS